MGALRHAFLLMTAALLLSGIALAQSQSAEFYANGNGGVQTADREFMSKAAQEGIEATHLAWVALQNAHSEQVKAFARQILFDSYNASTALTDIANQQFVALPTEIDPKYQATLESLLELHGEAFDKAYMQLMLSSQRTDLEHLKKEAKSGNNQSMIDWANKNLPALQKEFKEAEKIAPAVGLEPTENKGETKSDSAAQQQH
jgi:putative membrane protein